MRRRRRPTAAPLSTRTETFGEYVSGQAAYALWISLLEADDDSAFVKTQTDTHKVEDAGLPTLNRYCFRALLHARSAAEPFLRRRAAELPESWRPAVLKAAELYAEAFQALTAAGDTAWNPGSRRRQAAAIRKAMRLEAEAGRVLTHALEMKEARDAPATPATHPQALP